MVTEQRHVSRRGSLDDLDAVRASVSIPVLRRTLWCGHAEFMRRIARDAGMLLLIVAALEQSVLVSMLDRTESL